MSVLYDIACLVASLCYLPAYLFKKKFHSGFRARLGFLPPGLSLDKPLWVHAVSLGEAVMMKPLIEGLRKKYPGKHFVISTVTVTGNKIARGLAQPGDLVTYLPLDFSLIVSRVLKKIDPCLFIIAETELWPNLIMRLHANKVPCIVVNARISDKSFGGYRAIKVFIKPVLEKITLFSAQSARDRQRLIELGAPADKVVAAGNMKFDLTRVQQTGPGYAVYRQRLGLGNKEKLLVAASTHPEEEEILIGAYQGLLKASPSLSMLLAPRHPERTAQIEKLIARRGFSSQRISTLSAAPAANAMPGPARPIFILDSVGQLLAFYAAADIVFVGGSLVAHGGHNILEPAIFGKPILFGPHMFNFRDIAELFLANNAACMAEGPAQLFRRLAELLEDPAKARELGNRAQALVKASQGATVRNLELIEALNILPHDKK